MKKLLALILCVMMFVAVIPTAAFAEEPVIPAAGTTGGTPTPVGAAKTPGYVDLAAAKKAVSDLEKDIKAVYTAFAADELVFGTAKSVYSMTDSMAKELLKNTEKVKDANGKYVYQEDLISNVRKGMNAIIGNEILNYMNDRTDAWTNSDGNIQPDKYIAIWAKAVNNALGTEKAQKNIQALVYGLAALSAQQAMNDKADDLYDDIDDWGHWNEFNWYDIANLTPDKFGYDLTWRPAETTLIPTGSDALAYDAAGVHQVLTTGTWPTNP